MCIHIGKLISSVTSPIYRAPAFPFIKVMEMHFHYLEDDARAGAHTHARALLHGEFFNRTTVIFFQQYAAAALFVPKLKYY